MSIPVIFYIPLTQLRLINEVPRGSRPYGAKYRQRGNDKNSPLSLVTHPMIVAGESLWSDYSIEVGFTPQAKFDKCGVVFGYKHPADFYFFGVEGNTVTLKHVQQSVTPLRPIERILDSLVL